MNLQVTGFKGEGVVCDDDRVWITKIHPFNRFIPDLHFNAGKHLVLMRNPIDMFVSSFYLYVTTCHSATCNEDIKGNDAF